MTEALLTLHVVPVTTTMLTTTGVDKAVEGLLIHEAGKVRALARGILINQVGAMRRVGHHGVGRSIHSPNASAGAEA